MDNRPIGIFDSGVGGLSILREIKKLLPEENFVFVADQAHFPYGGKTEKQLQVLTSKICSFLLQNNVKAIVIACNTATVYAISHLRSKFDVPIIGTVPVVKTIVNFSKTKKAAVFSTPATSKSKYLNDLIKRFSNGTKIYKIEGAGLEGLVEDGDIKSKKVGEVLEKNLRPLIEKGIDAIALGCTHYPFVRQRIREIVGKDVLIVDSGAPVARRVREILTNNGILASKKGQDFYYTTDDPVHFKKVAETLLNRKLGNVGFVDL